MNHFNSIDPTIFTSFSFYWQTAIFMIIAYLIGSINFGHVFSKINNTDVGKIGSKNYGATNVGRNYGAKGFLFVFLGDFFKSFVALGIILFLNLKILTDGSIGLSLFFVLFGHLKPLYFHFKGGKGVASFCSYRIDFKLNCGLIRFIIFHIDAIFFKKSFYCLNIFRLYHINFYLFHSFY